MLVHDGVAHLLRVLAHVRKTRLAVCQRVLDAVPHQPIDLVLHVVGQHRLAQRHIVERQRAGCREREHDAEDRRKIFGHFGPVEQQIFVNEAARADVPLPYVTLQTVGPTLQAFGTQEQKDFFLPRILSGDLHFAIGYTEPGAGTHVLVEIPLQ